MVTVQESRYEILCHFSRKDVTLLCSGGKVKVHATATAIMALKLLASEFLVLHPSFAERVATLLFGLLLATTKVKVN